MVGLYPFMSQPSALPPLTIASEEEKFLEKRLAEFDTSRQIATTGRSDWEAGLAILYGLGIAARVLSTMSKGHDVR